MSILASNKLNYFSPVEFSCRTIQEEGIYFKLPSKNIEQVVMKVLRSSPVFKGRKNLIIRYDPSYIVVIYQLTYTDFTLKLFTFCKIKKLATAFFSIQSNA